MHTGEYEHCVLCGKETNVLMEMPLEQRAGYVEAVGQLCADCYGKLLEDQRDQGWRKGWERPHRQQKRCRLHLRRRH